MAQKNCMDPPAAEHHPPENEVDFELLWRFISKIPNEFGMATYMKGNSSNKIEIQLQ